MSRLRPGDVVRLAWLGLWGRPQRTVLAALGIAVGVAALIALTGVSASNREQLLAELDAMGADLAVVTPGVGADQEPVPLPQTAPQTLMRQDGVDRIGVFEVAPEGLSVYRSDLVPQQHTSGVGVAVARPDVLAAIGGRLVAGRWFDDASRALPVAVLGASAAERLGVERAGDRLLIGDQWYGVLGVLAPAGLATEVDTSVILGDRWVRERFSGEGIGDVAAVYVRAEPGRLEQVAGTLAAAASPGSPYVVVSTLVELAGARQSTDDSLARLGLALGGIALLVGGVGIANTMVVTVTERRAEIGLRRALGARPGQIAVQFVVEALVLSLLGGLVGVVLGSAASAVAATVTQQPVAVPLSVLVLGPAVSVLVGAVAGLQPALRAAGLPPTTALRTA